MIRKFTQAPNSNPHKLVGKTIEKWSLVFWGPNANHDKLLTKTLPSGAETKLASRRGVRAGKAWPQRSIVAHAQKSLLSQTSKLS